MEEYHDIVEHITPEEMNKLAEEAGYPTENYNSEDVKNLNDEFNEKIITELQESGDNPELLRKVQDIQKKLKASNNNKTAKTKKKRHIIYVFGPKRLSQDYYSGDKLTIENGGWIKIGLTTTDNNSEDIWDVAMKRINQEVKTGIAETCRLLDVFEFPLLQGKPDDKIRSYLTNGLYALENSMANNKLIVDKYEIRAGNEYIYGVTRANIQNAVKIFELDLLSSFIGTDEQEYFLECIIKNQSSLEEVSNEEEESSNKQYKGKSEYDDFWNKVLKKLPKQIVDCAHICKGRPYINFGNTTNSYQLNAVVSPQKNEAMVNLNGAKVGEVGRDEINKYIQDNNIPPLPAIQGTRCADRWYWPVSTNYDQSEEQLIDWFVENIQLYYNNFASFLK